MARAEEAGNSRRIYLISYWLTFLLFSIVLIISRFHHPSPNPTFVLCGFQTFVGLPCPACGLTRSFCALAKGELLGSFYFNQLGPLLFALMLFGWLAALLAIIGWPRFFNLCQRVVTNAKFYQWTITIMAFYWVARIVFLLGTRGFAQTVGKGLLAQWWR